MRLNSTALIISILCFPFCKLFAQYTLEETKSNPCFISSSAFMLMNLSSYETPEFFQVNFGYRITTKDVVSLELKTWRYFEPIGIPHGKLKSDPKENFPGYIREKGFAIAYQRFIWKRFYAAIHVMNAWQSFIDKKGNNIDNGFQIFNTYRLGYHIKLFKGKFFIEPSLAITHRPYHTTMPESFRIQDEKYSKFFFGEPGLHFGFNF
ncbi:hypothetical protein [Mesoflavibacter sp. CH_XMU1404-2]|uniref:hypothetical protein n=1 Tax=Mesoflavibacter sp. CH_XMU1404-2 TaxID=3107766 RepID=UPI00300BF29B